jgi:ADP-ribosylglycohydrolase
VRQAGHGGHSGSPGQAGAGVLGTTAGDVIGSAHEDAATKTKYFPQFVPRCRYTDDTVLTVAIAKGCLYWQDSVARSPRYFHLCWDAGEGERLFSRR